MRERLNYPVHGTFKVTTEGDVEGRTTTDLGTYTGYIDEIALKLASLTYYGLQFHLQKPNALDNAPLKKSSVNISFDIDSGTWPSDMSSEQRLNYFKNLFRDRPVTIEDGDFYASVVIKGGVSPEEQKALAEKIERDNAKLKLTPRERKLLGID